MYKCVIFDMDGTLADTSPGILASHRYAHKMMGQPAPEECVLRQVIGGPLLQTYQERFGFAEPEKAVAFYRQYYAEQGIHAASLYPGIADALRELYARGVLLGVATLKADRFVKQMLRDMGVFDCFSAIYGMDEKDGRTKAQLIQMCMSQLGTSAEETVLVGDSIHDMEGAEACGISFLGVTYGFGFSEQAEKGKFQMCSTPAEIVEKLEVLYRG